MNLIKVTCAYFSPGGTTSKVVSAIGEAFADYPIDKIDLTSWDNRQKEYSFHENELLIIGVPSYGGRVPAPVREALKHFKGLNTPLVLVGTYGNVKLGDVLIELRTELFRNGFIPVAAGAFICQHSYLADLAGGRPDREDMEKIHEFGQELRERLRLLVSYAAEPLNLPGSYPSSFPDKLEFPFRVETSDDCFYCMICAGICPMKAISSTNPKDIDDTACIRCGACIKICPAQAKSFTDGPFFGLQENYLRQFCEIRQEPWYVIG